MLVVRKNLCPRIRRNFTPAIVQILNKAVLDTGAQADPHTPVDQGLLKSNKIIESAAPGRLRSRLRWGQDYARYQNDGTRRGVRAKHFADKGFDAVAPGVEAALSSLEGRV